MNTDVDSNLWQAFERVARSRLDSTAIECGTQSLTFGELLHRAERCAHWLEGRAVRSGDVVALQLPKQLETYCLWLSCLRQGAVYVFVDPANPPERTRRILDRTRPALLVAAETENPFGATVRPGELQLLLSQPAPDEPWSMVSPARSHGLSPAYIMFTSGSTGEPKGAVIPHQGVLGLMAWVRSLIGDVSEHRFSNLNPLHFDNAVFDLYGGLLNGATLVAVETGASHNPLAWAKRLRARDASVVFAVPTLFLTLAQLHLLTPASLPGVKFFLFGGEGFPIGALKQFHASFKERARLINVYGPTETSCICSSLEVDASALDASGSGFISLGRMHSGFEHLILDPDRHPCTDGLAGELWIGGANVGLGYFNNPVETERRFFQDPRQACYRSIWYRTGDLVRQDSVGLLWFLGRADNQVKIRGHRIELEEIDLAVESFAGITRAVAVLHQGRDGPEIRVAFSASDTISENLLRIHCQEALPKYMQPARLVHVRVVPQNASGKADRRAVVDLIASDGAPVQ